MSTLRLADLFSGSALKETQLHHQHKLRAWADTTHGVLGSPRRMERFIAFVQDDAWIKPITGPVLDDPRPILAIAIQRTDGKHVLIQSVWEPGKFETKMELSGGAINLVGHSGAGAVVIEVTSEFNGFGDSSLSETFQHMSDIGDDDDDVRSLSSIESADPFENQENGTKSEPSSVAGSDSDGRLAWYEYLSFNSWNSLGTEVSHLGLIAGFEALNAQNIYPRVLIIDDGWQNVTQRRQLLANVEVAEKFPAKFPALAAKLKDHNVDQIFVWTAMIGYWFGFSTSSKLYKPSFWTVTADSDGVFERFAIPGPVDALAYYDDLFCSLKDRGINGVKLDVCRVLDRVKDIEPSNEHKMDKELPQHVLRSKLQQSYRAAIATAASKHGIQIIWCMAMVPYMLPIDSSGVPIGPPGPGVLRNSDDFYPNEPLSHFWHIYCNLYNTLYSRQFDHILDFDMFQSKMPTQFHLHEKMPSLHAAARVLSGGPITITDSLQTSNCALINHLTIGDERGYQSRVLRFDGPPAILKPYHRFSDYSLVLVRAGPTHDSHVIGAFNLSSALRTEEIHIPAGFMAREFRQGRISGFDADSATSKHDEWHLIGSDTTIVLDSGDWEIFNIAKIHSWNRSDIAVFGLLDKFIGIRAVSSIHLTPIDIELTLVGGGGTLGIYMEPMQAVITEIDGRPVEHETKDSLLTIPVPITASKITIALIIELSA